jgi:N utilization substance protein B
MARHRSRHRATQILYQIDLRGIAPAEAIQNYYGGLYSEESEGAPDPDDAESPPDPDGFMEELVEGTFARRSAIDAEIQRHSEHWRIERMPVVDRNILRLAVFELLQGKLPPAVVIDEAVELARRFSGKESARFMNGVLDALRKALPPTSESGPPPED